MLCLQSYLRSLPCVTRRNYHQSDFIKTNPMGIAYIISRASLSRMPKCGSFLSPLKL